MIKMSGSRRIRLLVALAVAGCCGSGSTHKCNFAPPGTDAGAPPTDGGTSCGAQVCAAPQVCCVTRTPLAALCIDSSEFQSRNCETSDLPCAGPTYCPKGFVCCLTLAQQSGIAACKSSDLCVPDQKTTYVVCNTAADCPMEIASCSQIGASDGGGVVAGVCTQ
jgi:hypothetical protein